MIVTQLDYLEEALLEASRAADMQLRPAKVFARFIELWDATMVDEIARATQLGTSRSPRWWTRKFHELRYMADRETPQGEGFEL